MCYFKILRSARWLREYWSFHQAWWLELDLWSPHCWRRKLNRASFPPTCPCVFVTTYFLTCMQNKIIKCLEENWTKIKIPEHQTKNRHPNNIILKHTTYLHAQNFQFHSGHYCYCLLANSWLAMSQQAMDNWGHQHLEDLAGWDRNEMEISLWAQWRNLTSSLHTKKGKEI